MPRRRKLLVGLGVLIIAGFAILAVIGIKFFLNVLLFGAVLDCNEPAVHKLLDLGANPNWRDPQTGAPLLCIAASDSSSEILEALIRRGADIHVEGSLGKPLAYASSHENVVALVMAGADPNSAIPWSGHTALMIFAGCGFDQTVAFLLKHGAGVNITNRTDGVSALMLASEDGYAECVRSLLDGGADASYRSQQGKTALDYARAGGHTNVVELLMEAAQKMGASSAERP